MNNGETKGMIVQSMLQVFFCDDCPDKRVREFETQEATPYESMAWSLTTFGVFAGKIMHAVWLKNCSDHGSTEESWPRILAVAGGKDVLM